MNKHTLGELTEEYEEINTTGELSSIDDLQGINNNKYFQQSNSNKNDIDLNRYKICRNNTFAYNKATSRNGEKISIAYRTTGDCLVSPSYITFKVTRPDLILDEYLMLWFRRPEFDRYVRFNSWGSATEFFTYDDFAETEIDVPSIEEQNERLHEYITLTKNINVLNNQNLKLEDICYNHYLKCFNNDSEEANESKKGKLGDFVKIKRGGSPRPIEEYIRSVGLNWLKISDATSSESPYIFNIAEHIDESGLNKTVLLKKGSLVLSNSATPGMPKILEVDSCIHDGWLYFPNGGLCQVIAE